MPDRNEDSQSQREHHLQVGPGREADEHYDKQLDQFDEREPVNQWLGTLSDVMCGRILGLQKEKSVMHGNDNKQLYNKPVA